MNAEPYPSWDEKLDRALQSWRDSAAHQARRPMFADDRACEDCQRDPYIVIAQLEDDSTAHRWPHWMVNRPGRYAFVASTRLSDEGFLPSKLSGKRIELGDQLF